MSNDTTNPETEAALVKAELLMTLLALMNDPIGRLLLDTFLMAGKARGLKIAIESCEADAARHDRTGWTGYAKAVRGSAATLQEQLDKLTQNVERVLGKDAGHDLVNK